MIIIDTNVISEAFRPNPDAAVMAWLDSQESHSLFLTSVSLAELRFGVALLPEGRRKALLTIGLDDIVTRLFAGRCLVFDEGAANVFGNIMAEASRAGVAVSNPDGQIAAIAIAHGCPVATRDTSPFLACSVPVINPWLWNATTTTGENG